MVDLNNFFNQPGIFGFGNADDYLSSPAIQAVPTGSIPNVQVSKYFAFTERWKLQLRAEYFNVLNHPNFAPESISTGTVNGTDQISAFDKLNSAFGTFRAGQAGDPRVAQLAAKLFF